MVGCVCYERAVRQRWAAIIPIAHSSAENSPVTSKRAVYYSRTALIIVNPTALTVIKAMRARIATDNSKAVQYSRFIASTAD